MDPWIWLDRHRNMRKAPKHSQNRICNFVRDDEFLRNKSEQRSDAFREENGKLASLQGSDVTKRPSLSLSLLSPDAYQDLGPWVVTQIP